MYGNTPGQIFRAEAHDAVTGLPCERFAVADFVIDEVSACALQLADPFADVERRRHAHGQVYVVLNAAYGVNDHSVGLQRTLPNVAVGPALDCIHQYLRIVLRVSCQMKMNLAENIARPGRYPVKVR